MERFKGTVRLPGDPFELSAVVIVADGRLSISAREHTLGDWPLDGISADVQPDGCHVQVGHEALTVQWQGGAPRIVWPPKHADGSLIYPRPIL